MNEILPYLFPLMQISLSTFFLWLQPLPAVKDHSTLNSYISYELATTFRVCEMHWKC